MKIVLENEYGKLDPYGWIVLKDAVPMESKQVKESILTEWEDGEERIVVKCELYNKAFCDKIKFCDILLYWMERLIPTPNSGRDLARDYTELGRPMNGILELECQSNDEIYIKLNLPFRKQPFYIENSNVKVRRNEYQSTKKMKRSWMAFVGIPWTLTAGVAFTVFYMGFRYSTILSCIFLLPAFVCLIGVILYCIFVWVFR